MMEDDDVVFLGHGPQNKKNLPTSFPIQPSTSRQVQVVTKKDNNSVDPVPLRRNPDRSVKIVSKTNAIGHNGIYISPPKTKKAMQPKSKPLTPAKIQKLEQMCSSKSPRTKEFRPKPQPKRKQKIQEVKKVSPSKAPRTKESRSEPKPKKKQKIEEVKKVSPSKAPRTEELRLPQPKKKQKIQEVKKELTIIPLPAVEQPKEDPSYQKLLALQDADVVPNAEGVDCPVCNCWVSPGNGVVLKDCLHSFCRICLENAVRNSQTATVKCPFICQEYKCESHLQDREVKSLVSPEDYERHLARSVYQAQCLSTKPLNCALPGCTGWYLADDIRRLWFTCPMCFSQNCIPCQAIHNILGCPRDSENISGRADHMISWLNNLLTVKENLAIQGTRIEVSNEPKTLSNLAENQKNDYMNLLEVTDMGLVTNTETFDCPICFSDIAIGEGVTLKDCLHNYCRECITATIRHCDTALVKCPFVNDEYACESFLQDREVKSLLTPEEFERHLQMSLALVERQSANSFHCKTPDCAGWCLVEDDANQFFCQVCKHFNCLSCAAIHEGKNCKQYQDMASLEADEKTKKYLEKQLKSNKAMACPTCQIIVMKREGCDWLVCAMCHTEICWATKGPRWGPGGKGDTSGGCKCDREKKKLCHPNCYNCH